MSDEAAEIIERFYQLSEQDQRKVLLRLQGREDPVVAIARERCAEIESGTARTIAHSDVQQAANEQIETFRRQQAKRGG